ncbi:MAG: hypothetical protein E3J72_04360 [Planctomycetota bacterium]|nr:MAG: hypothetical protein E3J72_04360 [Planctomycetota bacterium]
MLRFHALAGVLLITGIMFSGCAAHRYKLVCTSPELPVEHGGLKVAKVDATVVCADDLYDPDTCPVFFRLVIENPTKKKLPIDFNGLKLVLDDGKVLRPDFLPGSSEPGVPFQERMRRINFHQTGLDVEYICIAEDATASEKVDLKIDSMVGGIALLMPGYHCVLRIGFNVGKEIERCTLVMTLGRGSKRLELKWGTERKKG